MPDSQAETWDFTNLWIEHDAKWRPTNVRILDWQRASHNVPWGGYRRAVEGFEKSEEKQVRPQAATQAIDIYDLNLHGEFLARHTLGEELNESEKLAFLKAYDAQTGKRMARACIRYCIRNRMP